VRITDNEELSPVNFDLGWELKLNINKKVTFVEHNQRRAKLLSAPVFLVFV